MTRRDICRDILSKLAEEIHTQKEFCNASPLIDKALIELDNLAPKIPSEKEIHKTLKSIMCLDIRRGIFELHEALLPMLAAAIHKLCEEKAK